MVKQSNKGEVKTMDETTRISLMNIEKYQVEIERLLRLMKIEKYCVSLTKKLGKVVWYDQQRNEINLPLIYQYQKPYLVDGILNKIVELDVKQVGIILDTNKMPLQVMEGMV